MLLADVDDAEPDEVDDNDDGGCRCTKGFMFSSFGGARGRPENVSSVSNHVLEASMHLERLTSEQIFWTFRHIVQCGPCLVFF